MVGGSTEPDRFSAFPSGPANRQSIQPCELTSERFTSILLLSPVVAKKSAPEAFRFNPFIEITLAGH